jgi:hypothetical protein
MAQREKGTENGKYNRRRLLGILFPKKNTLEKKYPEIKKNIFFYPRAWTKRLISFVKKTDDMEKVKKLINPYKELELNESSLKRLEMLNTLNIIDNNQFK